MPKKTTIKTNRTTAQQTVKLAKGSFYQDLGDDLWFCANAKQKKVGDELVVMMQAPQGGRVVTHGSIARVFNKLSRRFSQGYR